MEGSKSGQTGALRRSRAAVIRGRGSTAGPQGGSAVVDVQALASRGACDFRDAGFSAGGRGWELRGGLIKFLAT